MNKQLTMWVYTQRKMYKNGKLSQDKIDLLNKIHNWEWCEHNKVEYVSPEDIALAMKCLSL